MLIFNTKPNSEGFFSKFGRLTSQKFYILRKPKLLIKKQNQDQSDNSLFVEEFMEENQITKKLQEKEQFPIQQNKLNTLQRLSRTSTFQNKIRSQSLQSTINSISSLKNNKLRKISQNFRNQSLEISKYQIDLSRISTDFQGIQNY